MPSLYAQYLKEKTRDEIYECEAGFITYRFLPEQSAVYIIDIYVAPSERRARYGTWLADQVVGLAREKGMKEVLGTVLTNSPSATESIKALLGYGFKLKNSGPDVIFLWKEI